MATEQNAINAFRSRFGAEPAFVARAPGRVNLIGEHTDYNEGFVLPIAIDRAVWIALRPRPDGQVVLHSINFGDQDIFDLGALHHDDSGWIEYVKGVAWALQEEGYDLSGWEGVVVGDVPVGAGLSSSAALEMAVTRAFATVSNLPWDIETMAKVAQRAENEWVGINSGIMDQMISAGGKYNHALLIDCRSLTTELVPLPLEAAVVVMDTGTRRSLVDSAYNQRREQCESAAAFLGVPALRDVDMNTFEAKGSSLEGTIRRRTRHVISENERTWQAVTAMRQGDTTQLGRLMNGSHTSLRDDFEVSSDELNMIVSIAKQHTGCYGARMTGAGFGGCAIALVQADKVDSFVFFVGDSYQLESGITPVLYVCAASNGATITVCQ